MKPMNERERFLATMRYEPRDRCPIYDFGFWEETVEAWHAQGLPDWVTGGHDTTHTGRYFGMDSYVAGTGFGIWVGLSPGFEYQVIEDRGDQEVIRDGEGVLQLRHKKMGSIPVQMGHLLTDRASWEEHFLPRLNPDTPGRMPTNEQLATLGDADAFTAPRVTGCGSLYGWIRNWMGVENVSYLVYDDPALFEEMVETITVLNETLYTRAFEAGARFDCATFWEDMCYNAGPLLTPSIFNRVLVPRYRRIMDLFHRYGCEFAWLDCDGKIDDLIPGWLEAGVNIMFPIEVGTWGADPVKLRSTYGKDLRMMGGFDKHILAKGKGPIEAEVTRLAPLVEEGGFTPFCDHRVPPDVPLENYLHYLRLARRVWGKGVYLRPLMADDQVTV